MHRPGTLWRTVLLTFTVIISNAVGNLFLSFGMKSQAGILSLWIPAGVALLVFWTLSRMTLLSWADLSYVLPVTALGFPLSAFMGKIFLNEQVSNERWLGTLLIVSGTFLVGLTPPSTKRDQ